VEGCGEEKAERTGVGREKVDIWEEIAGELGWRGYD